MKKFIKKLIADYKEAQQRPDEWDEMDYYERKNYTRSVLCGCSFVLNIFLVIFIIIALVCSHSCSTPSHIQTVQAEQMQASPRQGSRTRPQQTKRMSPSRMTRARPLR